ncbi:hypothetical protein [Cytobacillus gottheilii]|uniref:hypothetical protein n=1 Tax=Cytobacillus gottheilii TaxID=859144 RepID=UPI0024946C34|nr:hypothetical protein [Cytobacillus gottheilii]
MFEKLKIIQQKLQMLVDKNDKTSEDIKRLQVLCTTFPTPTDNVLDSLGRDILEISKYYNEHFLEYKLYPSILANDVMTLPKSRGKSEDLYPFLKELFNTYKEMIKEVDDVFEVGLEIEEPLNNICSSIITSIEHYYNGHPSKSFETLSEGINKISSHFQMFLSNRSSIPFWLYRMRKTEGVNKSYTPGEMFHIPYNLRHLIATQRYSIPGLPSLYLGSTSYVCWEELGRPLLENTQAAIVPTKSAKIKVLDFGIRPFDYSEDILGKITNRQDAHLTKQEFQELKNYLIVWPLIAACSIQVNHQNGAFKPEYIIPQLILQWITSTQKYDGIRYFSVKEECQNNSVYLIHNYVFPAKSNHETKGHCYTLRRHFTVSQGTPWQLFKLHPIPLQGILNGDFALMANIPTVHYNQTDFGKIEGYLFNNTLCEAKFTYKISLSDLYTKKDRGEFFEKNKKMLEENLDNFLNRDRALLSSHEKKSVQWTFQIHSEYIELHLTCVSLAEFIFNGSIPRGLISFSQFVNDELNLGVGYKLFDFQEE